MSAWTSSQKGQLAFLKVQIEAAKKGAVVSVPTVPARYDLVIDYQGKLHRAQVKYADGKAPRSEGAIRLDLRRRKKCYTRDEIDVVLVYVPQIDRICWFAPEVFHEKASLFLRLQPAKNGQQRGCRMLDGFIW